MKNNPNPVSMNVLMKNDQDYLAERFHILEEQTNGQSKIALLQIRSWKFSTMHPEVGPEYQQGVAEMVQHSLLQFVPNSYVLSEEGYYFSMMDN